MKDGILLIGTYRYSGNRSATDWIRVALLDAWSTTWQLNCVTLGEQPAQRESRSGLRQLREPSTQPNAAAEIRGIGVETLDADTARRLGLRAGTQARSW